MGDDLKGSTAIPRDRDNLPRNTKLGRVEGATGLTAVGWKTAPATLTTKASRGDGPPYSICTAAMPLTWRVI